MNLLITSFRPLLPSSFASRSRSSHGSTGELEFFVLEFNRFVQHTVQLTSSQAKCQVTPCFTYFHLPLTAFSAKDSYTALLKGQHFWAVTGRLSVRNSNETPINLTSTTANPSVSPAKRQYNTSIHCTTAF